MLGPKSLDEKGAGDEQPGDWPTGEATAKYWEGVIGVLGEYNPADPAILEWQRAVNLVQLDPEEHDPEYWDHAWGVALKKSRCWKVPGHDGICAFLVEEIPPSCGSTQAVHRTDS